MTGWDTFFIALALVEVICLGVIIGIAIKLAETGKQALARSAPLLKGAAALATRSAGMAAGFQKRTGKMLERSGAVDARVRKRVRRVGALARELRPLAEATTTAVQVASSVATSGPVGAAARVRNLGSLAGRLRRLASAADAAAKAGRKDSTQQL